MAVAGPIWDRQTLLRKRREILDSRPLRRPEKYDECRKLLWAQAVAGPARRFYLLRKWIIQVALPLLVLTLGGFLVMGYHPGLEDDGVYLTAIKANLHPALYPHDSEFFRLQLQASAFDGAMAHFVRWTGIPLAWSELAWQLAALFIILWACRRIASQIFEEALAQWAAVAMVAAMFTLPVAGTALNIA